MNLCFHMQETSAMIQCLRRWSVKAWRRIFRNNMQHPQLKHLLKFPTWNVSKVSKVQKFGTPCGNHWLFVCLPSSTILTHTAVSVPTARFLPLIWWVTGAISSMPESSWSRGDPGSNRPSLAFTNGSVKLLTVRRYGNYRSRTMKIYPQAREGNSWRTHIGVNCF